MKMQWNVRVGCLGFVLLLLLFLTECSVKASARCRCSEQNETQQSNSSHRVRLRRLSHRYVLLDNGLVQVTLSTPGGMVTGIRYKGIDNLLEYRNKASQRGYWDNVWSDPHDPKQHFDVFEGTSYRIIQENENVTELSFRRPWNPSIDDYGVPVNLDKRFIMLRDSHGFYTYTKFERPEGWPDLDIVQTRLVFKLQGKLFHYMAIADDRQKIMPSDKERAKGQMLAYPEAVKMKNGEVDDKYQYSSNIKDGRVHGWICSKRHIGFWMILPSEESRCGGPLKQELTSHVGPTSLTTFCSGHYAGYDLNLKLRDGEPWKKVLGPVFIYLNSGSGNDNEHTLWTDAKEQMLKETESWPYDFSLSPDLPHADKRGTIKGRFQVRDRYISDGLINASAAHVGLAPPGGLGSFQWDSKGYQYWNETDADGNFLIRGVRPGTFNLYGWVPGFIGDYKYEASVSVRAGRVINLGNLVYEPPRNGSTLWEIGIPDRTAAEFYVPDTYPGLVNKLYLNHTEKFRQYGLWARYKDLYPDQDLVYTVNVSNYRTDWFFAHVNRDVGNADYEPTTWRIIFELPYVAYNGTYTLQLAMASGNSGILKVWINSAFQDGGRPRFRTGHIGRDNAIARHAIHGLYYLHSVDIPGYLLNRGTNTFYLGMETGLGPFFGFMYDYIRLEAPPALC